MAEFGRHQMAARGESRRFDTDQCSSRLPPPWRVKHRPPAFNPGSGERPTACLLPEQTELERERTEMRHQQIILGRNRRDAEAQRDRWLSEHPEIKVLRVHGPKPEPRTLLTRIGGRNVPRVSIKVEYE